MKYSCVFIVSLFINLYTYSCSVFYASDENNILAGKNVDWKVPECQLKFFPSTSVTYGYVSHCIKYLGNYFTTNGGFNDQGLFIEWTDILFERDIHFRVPDETIYKGNIEEKILTSFSTVEEVINFFRTYYTPGFSSAHLMVGDRSGNSVVIERADNDSLTFIKNSKLYQVSTNFLNSYMNDPKMDDLVGCYRYTYIDKMLGNNKSISVDLFRTILDGAANKSQQYPTIYSIVYDLKNLDIYAYVYHNYEEALKFNLIDELEKGKRNVLMTDLFSHIKGIFPISNEVITCSSINLSWYGDALDYEILLSTDNEFNAPLSYITGSVVYQDAGIPALFVLLSILLLLLVQRNKGIFITIIFILSISGCEKDLVKLPDTISTIEHTKTVNGLLPNKTYYWKIIASGRNGYKTESKVYNFITSELKK